MYVKFSIPLVENNFFQYSTPPMGMRFCRHVPNSKMNKIVKSHNSCLLPKMVFLASKTLLSPSITWGKTNFINFECYGLANGKQ